MKIKKSELILTEEEKNNLRQTIKILNNIAVSMDRASTVDWSDYDDEEIWGACELIASFLKEDWEDIVE